MRSTESSARSRSVTAHAAASLREQLRRHPLRPRRGLPLDARAEQVQKYEAPLLSEPPAYGRSFCARCGSPLPIEIEVLGLVELPAAALDDAIASRPSYHMFVPRKAPWHEIADGLPQHETSPLAEKVLIPLLKRDK